MTDDVPPVDPTPPPTEPSRRVVRPPSDDRTPSELSPIRESAGTRFGEAVARFFLGATTFVIGLFVFGTVVGANQRLGLLVSCIAVAGLFWWRKRGGPSPTLGAAAFGVALAAVLAGGCALIVLSIDH